MINVIVYKKSGEYMGFRCEGHAGYVAEGYDPVCAAVSVLTVNTVNSIEQFTSDGMTVDADEDGLVVLQLEEDSSDKTKLLLDSMVLGLEAIQKSYGNEYIRLIFKEV
ncbi:MAG: ribosomal-processing cysteine protease Prp [Eubacteriales bacterium]|nr:ribosomal-processing cysteine protease Prp [Eubacteriales bacterium]